jgi:hypothetical protein
VSSFAVPIREAIFRRVSTLDGYAKYRRVLEPQLQPDDLPCISVAILSETMSPDGDINAGVPHFISLVTIGISVIRGFEDTSFLDGKIDADISDIETKLLTDPTFVELVPTALFEGITQITRRRLYPQDGETYFCELRLEMTFQTRVDYPPDITTPFSGVSMQTATAGASAGTLRIGTIIDVEE